MIGRRWGKMISSVTLVVSLLGTAVFVFISPVNKLTYLTIGILSLMVSTAAMIVETHLLLRHVVELLQTVDRFIAIRGAELRDRENEQ